MKIFERYVVKYNAPRFESYHKGDEVYVALDTSSGGYPFQVNSQKAHDFGSYEKAKQYADMFSNQGVSVCLLTYSVTEEYIFKG